MAKRRKPIKRRKALKRTPIRSAWEKRKAEDKVKKKPKYGNKTTVAPDGSRFPSVLECDTYLHLLLLEKAGEIRFLRKQVNVEMTAAKVLYIVDFLIYDLAKNEEVWVEAKGFETDVWRLKRRLWKHYGPGRLQVYRRGQRGAGYVVLAEEIVSKKVDQ